MSKIKMLLIPFKNLFLGKYHNSVLLTSEGKNIEGTFKIFFHNLKKYNSIK